MSSDIKLHVHAINVLGRDILGKVHDNLSSVILLYYYCFHSDTVYSSSLSNEQCVSGIKFSVTIPDLSELNFKLSIVITE